MQLYVSGGAAALLGLYAFTMPKCPPESATGKRSLASALGLDAFVLFRNTQMLVFFIASPALTIMGLVLLAIAGPTILMAWAGAFDSGLFGR